MRKTRILIVDDDPNLSRLAGMVLEQTNLYEIRIENQSTRAMATARQFRPEIVLLDVDMPVKSGGDIARELRGDAELFQTPIIFLTALVSKNEAGRRELVSGGSRFLAKPVEPSVLIECVGKLAREMIASG